MGNREFVNPRTNTTCYHNMCELNTENHISMLEVLLTKKIITQPHIIIIFVMAYFMNAKLNRNGIIYHRILPITGRGFMPNRLSVAVKFYYCFRPL